MNIKMTPKAAAELVAEGVASHVVVTHEDGRRARYSSLDIAMRAVRGEHPDAMVAHDDLRYGGDLRMTWDRGFDPDEELPCNAWIRHVWTSPHGPDDGTYPVGIDLEVTA